MALFIFFVGSRSLNVLNFFSIYFEYHFSPAIKRVKEFGKKGMNKKIIKNEPILKLNLLITKMEMGNRIDKSLCRYCVITFLI